MGDTVKSAIPLDGIGAKAILIDRSSADGAGVLAVADRVGCAEPMLQYCGQIEYKVYQGSYKNLGIIH